MQLQQGLQGRNFRNSRVPEFEINLKKGGGSDGRNVVKKNNLDEEVSPKSIINENTSSRKYRQLLDIVWWVGKIVGFMPFPSLLQ